LKPISAAQLGQQKATPAPAKTPEQPPAEKLMSIEDVKMMFPEDLEGLLNF